MCGAGIILLPLRSRTAIGADDPSLVGIFGPVVPALSATPRGLRHPDFNKMAAACLTRPPVTTSGGAPEVR
ncbi:hypothetical protein GDO81_003532 [Engystomops pustulosus]|uniref:Uncharacterized protein n=1 Tax=Engystomops pustulosus TaxID=76066 RepID=A0AAV6ZWR5_ENGPU|nr:hypothetical protein GDO81_003532 [Engystomops pustulosus]